MNIRILASHRLLGILLVTSTVAFGAHAGPANEVKAAVVRLAASQHIEQYWPVIVQDAVADGANKVIRGVLRMIDANAALNDAEREKMKEAVNELSPQIAAEVDTLYRKVDIKALNLEMIETMYSTYFSPAEMVMLAQFYESSAFQKSFSILLVAAEVSKRTGQDPWLLMPSLEAQLTPQENQALLEFYNSPLGQKNRELGPKLNYEGVQFIESRLATTLDAVLTRFHEQCLGKIRSSPGAKR